MCLGTEDQKSKKITNERGGQEDIAEVRSEFERTVYVAHVAEQFLTILTIQFSCGFEEIL